ncbi:MAG: hypothetical protein DI565_02970 [Ancylobacter novellus]|uniref:Thermostable hemolysin n=1 Tax=Ancylobacter novellus TaxID=921 RepID=A0A2W5KNV5_ANCNO|nr:MAG: hypothetical protein DI565_02970 [Ancylobacter novellus]
MQVLNWIPQRHRRRGEVEAFIRRVYHERYDAQVSSFPPCLAVRYSPLNEIVCAAGIRTARQGFFSEVYLDQPVDRRLSGLAGVAVDRDAVFEVTTLASRSPLATAAFIEQIGAHSEAAGFDWGFFTLSATMRFLIERQRRALIVLAPADPRRLPDAADWGAYYEQDPEVCAVASTRLAGLATSKHEESHAHAG